MPLLPLFDRSLIGRAASAALDYEAATGACTTASFGDLEIRSNQLAHLLRAQGLKAGDRIAFFHSNRIDVVDLTIAEACADRMRAMEVRA